MSIFFSALDSSGNFNKQVQTKVLLLNKIPLIQLHKKYRFFIILFVLMLPMLCFSQQLDTTKLEPTVDTALVSTTTTFSKLELFLKENKYLNSSSNSQTFSELRRTSTAGYNKLFYVILGLAFFYALFFYFFRKYVSDVFRLYLNTSINKSQITDQLRQDELPSFLSNIIFIVGMALFATQVIFNTTGKVTEKINYLVFIAGLLAVIYLVKYFGLRFTGWVSSFSTQAGLYIFIVFIVNKALGFIIFPLAVVLALGTDVIRQPVIILGFVTIVVLLLTRFIKAFNIIRSSAKLQVFHFLIFIFAVEVLPLLLLYKAGKMYLINLS